MRARREWIRWAASAALLLPFLYPFVTHFQNPPAGMSPSGFIQPDMPYYVGNAREHFDDGAFRLTYGLPYSPSYETPRLYFQPQTIVLAAVMRLTAMDPAVLFLGFGVLAGLACIRLALLLFERRFGLERPAQWLTATSLVWGGGLLVAGGAIRWLSTGRVDDLLAYDPHGGMWFLNLGRNFIYPHEAYYHALWIGAVILLAAKRYWPAFAMVALTSMSHPFTGVQLIGIVFAWGIAERFFFKNREVPMAFIVASGALLLAHLGYYRVFLARSREHQIVELQWIVSTQDWTIDAKHFLPAYAIVAALAAWVLRTKEKLRTVFADPFARFLAAWAIGSFALENNEWFLTPNIQPLHFTRGYVWMALFLLGAPALIALFDRALRMRLPARLATVGALSAVLWSDNAVFLGTFQARRMTGANQMWLPSGFRALASFLSEPAQAGALVLTPDNRGEAFNHFAYLLTVYTPLRTWNSHPFNTPAALDHHEDMLRLFETGVFHLQWEGKKLLIVTPSSSPTPSWIAKRNGSEVYTSPDWRVFRIGG